jgi:hypothetical protein
VYTAIDNVTKLFDFIATTMSFLGEAEEVSRCDGYREIVKDNSVNRNDYDCVFFETILSSSHKIRKQILW